MASQDYRMRPIPSYGPHLSAPQAHYSASKPTMEPSTSRSLLNLPYEIRLKIYTFSGLVRPCPIDLAWKPFGLTLGTGPNRNQPNPYECYWRLRNRGITRFGKINQEGRECFCPNIPVQLLSVSRAVNADVVPILYGKNKIVLRAHTAADLAPLQRLNGTSIAAMSSLLVRLNCWPCPRGHDQVHPSPSIASCWNCSTPLSKADAPLSITAPGGRDVVRSWEALCSHLSSAAAVIPGKLKFTLICDVEDQASAQQVIDALRLLPQLKSCTIRLGRQPDPSLNTLARETSFKMTKAIAHSPGNFPFSRLPRELRLKILNYTHLGSQGDHNERYNLLRIEESKLVTGNLVPIGRPKCCSACTETFADCCCPISHASYSASCECRILPFELFLVSKQMRSDAMEVFFKESCFDFAQDPDETIAFLMGLPERGRVVRFIRNVQFRITVYQLNRWYIDSLDFQWLSLVQFIKRNLNIEKLSIVINTSAAFDLCLWPDDDEEERNRGIYDVYCSITDSLLLLRGQLQNLQFELGWFTGLAPLLAKEVMGDRYTHSEVEVVKHKEEKDETDRMHEVPSWYNERNRG